MADRTAKNEELARFPPALWACFWLADIEKLRILTQQAEDPDTRQVSLLNIKRILIDQDHIKVYVISSSLMAAQATC